MPCLQHSAKQQYGYGAAECPLDSNRASRIEQYHRVPPIFLHMNAICMPGMMEETPIPW